MPKSNVHLHIILTAIMLTVFSVFRCDAEDIPPGLDLRAEVSSKDIELGDRIDMTVTVSSIKGVEIKIPEEPPMLGEFSFVSSEPVEEGWGASSREGMVYVLSIYTTGPHDIPPVPIRYRSGDQTGWDMARTPRITVNVKSVLTGQAKDIRSVKGLIPYGGMLRAVLLAVGAVTVLILTAIVFFFVSRRYFAARAARQRRTPYEIAHDELEVLRKEDLPGHGKVKEYYTRLSDIIREYLEARFSYKAPEMTTEEFMAMVKRSPSLDATQRRLLGEFLSHCDLVKFAKYGPSPEEILDSFRAASSFVDETRPMEEEETGEEAK